MKIKILWGFVGNGVLLGADSDKVKAGATFDDANDEYAHTLIGKGLAVEVGSDGKPKLAKARESKPASAKETKAAADKVAADEATAKEAADKAEADKAAAEKAAAEAK